MAGQFFNSSGALKDAAVLAGGAISGQLVVLALSPLLTRLFTPDQIGTLGVFSAAVAILSVIAPLGYDQAIIGARTRSEAIRSVALSITLGSFACVVLPALGYLLVQASGGQRLEPAFVLSVSVTTIAAIAVSVSQGWYIRERRLFTAGSGAFTNMAGRTSLQVIAGAFHTGTLGLLAGEVIGRISTLVVMDRARIARLGIKVGVRYSRRVRAQALALRTFPIYQMPSSALDTLLAWLPLPLVAFAYGPETAGLVTLIQRIGTAPASLIGQSIVQIYHQRATLYIDGGRKHLINNTIKLFVAGSLLFAPFWTAILLWGEDLFRFAFGDQWSGAGTIAAIWAPLVLVQIFAQIASRLLILIGKQSIRFVGLAAAVAMLIGTMLIGARLSWPFSFTLSISVACMILVYAIWISWALVATRKG